MVHRMTVLLVVGAVLLLAGPLSGQQGKGPHGKGKGPSSAGQSSAGQSGAGQSGAGQGHAGQGGAGQGAAGRAGMGQRGMGKGGMGKGGMGQRGQGRGGDAAMQADRDLFHELLTHRAEIRRTVKPIDGGVETLTESDNPAVATAIRKHVGSMKKRVEGANPIHLRDPLFAEVFRHAEKIEFAYEKTKQGVRVVETSDDPYVAKLIQAHAEVVSLFLKNGFDEVHKNHAVPAKP
jgi:hypothetical protein